MNAEFVSLLAYFIPLCTIAAGVLIAAIKMRPANTTAGEAVTEGQWRRFQEEIKRLDARILVLEREIETCHAERDTARAEELKWKAIAEASGQMRQEAALAAANERLAEREDRGGEKERGE